MAVNNRGNRKPTGPKTPDARKRQLDALARGRAKREARQKAEREGLLAASPKQGDATPDQWQRIFRANIIQFATSKENLGIDLWPAQEVVLRAMYGLPIPDILRPLYQQITYLTQTPDGIPNCNETVFEPDVEKYEAVLVAGRRASKSTLTAIIALYEATRPHWQQYTLDGEDIYVIHIATSQKQSDRIVGRMIHRLLDNAGRNVRGILIDDTRSEIGLANGVRIASFPTNSIAFRGLPCCCAILDEIAFFFREGPKADEGILEALEPAMAQFDGKAKTLMLSSPGGKSGLLWEWYCQGAQVPGRLTIQAPTLTMNPTISPAVVERRQRQNPEAAEREYGAQFSERIDDLYSDEMINSCSTLTGDQLYYFENTHIAGLDASGLSGRDRMGFAICHDRDGMVVNDVLRSWDVDAKSAGVAFREIYELFQTYNVSICVIDQFAKGFVTMLLANMAEQGVETVLRPPLQSVHMNAKSLMIAGKLRMQENAELKDGLLKTRVYYSKTNKPTVGRERSRIGHGDLADALVSAVWGTCEYGANVAWIVETDENIFGPGGEPRLDRLLEV